MHTFGNKRRIYIQMYIFQKFMIPLFRILLSNYYNYQKIIPQTFRTIFKFPFPEKKSEKSSKRILGTMFTDVFWHHSILCKRHFMFSFSSMKIKILPGVVAGSCLFCFSPHPLPNITSSLSVTLCFSHWSLYEIDHSVSRKIVRHALVTSRYRCGKRM